MPRFRTSRPFAIAALLAALALSVAPAVSETPRKGGALRIGMIGEPPTLDAHVTTATITREIGINMFETLFALDAKYQPVPLLVETHDMQDGGKRYVLKLRKGV
jgi:peptide/nickel transport system substrate-binding protein